MSGICITISDSTTTKCDIRVKVRLGSGEEMDFANPTPAQVFGFHVAMMLRRRMNDPKMFRWDRFDVLQARDVSDKGDDQTSPS